MEETVKFSELQIFLFRIGDSLPGLGFDDCRDAGFCVILDELRDEADRGVPDATRVKDALVRLRAMLIGGESKTADIVLEEIDRLAQSIG